MARIAATISFRTISSNSNGISLLSAVAAMGYPRPTEETENIPKLMEEATLVCKGEVISAPKAAFGCRRTSHDRYCHSACGPML
jgi:hypothetical protein